MKYKSKRYKKNVRAKYKFLFPLAAGIQGWKLYHQVIGACGAFSAAAMAICAWFPVHTERIAMIAQCLSLMIMGAIIAILSIAYWKKMHSIKSAAQANKALPDWLQSLLAPTSKK